MKYKAVIFDMDGTVLDTLSDLTSATNHALFKCGFPNRTEEEVKSFVGNGIHRLCELAVPRGTEKAKIEEVFGIFNEYYAVHCNDSTKPYGGVIDAIKSLKSEGIKVAVVSNKSDYAVKSLCHIYFDGIFDFEIGAKDGIRRKPHPDSVNLLLSEMGIEKSDALYIGDSEVDVETAENAGIDCISVSWGFRPRNLLEKLNSGNIADTVDKMLEMIRG